MKEMLKARVRAAVEARVMNKDSVESVFKGSQRMPIRTN